MPASKQKPVVPKPTPLPMPKLGMDTLSQETSLPAGAVRELRNIIVANDGNFQRRPGYKTLIELPGAHSLWKSGDDLILAAADKTLYAIDVVGQSATGIFTGLTPDAPVEYSRIGPETWFSTPDAIGKICADGEVRRPGVANLIGTQPTLTPTVGSLDAGTYGVAYSLLNDLGEESGISTIAWITLASVGGILMSGLQTATDVTRMNVYVTSTNGEELMLYGGVSAGPSMSITDRTRTKIADRQFLAPMPAGDIVRHYRGRTLVASGRWLYPSRPFDYGVRDVRNSAIDFVDDITILQPVQAGVFVGTAKRVVYLGGENFAQPSWLTVSSYGAFPHSAMPVNPAFLDEGLFPERGQPHAGWLSKAGLVIGRPDGSVVHAQSARVEVAAGVARPWFWQRRGVKQCAFFSESVAFSGAVDQTV